MTKKKREEKDDGKWEKAWGEDSECSEEQDKEEIMDHLLEDRGRQGRLGIFRVKRQCSSRCRSTLDVAGVDERE